MYLSLFRQLIKKQASRTKTLTWPPASENSKTVRTKSEKESRREEKNLAQKYVGKIVLNGGKCVTTEDFQKETKKKLIITNFQRVSRPHPRHIISFQTNWKRGNGAREWYTRNLKYRLKRTLDDGYFRRFLRHLIMYNSYRSKYIVINCCFPSNIDSPIIKKTSVTIQHTPPPCTREK